MKKLYLTLALLINIFSIQGMENPFIEATKYNHNHWLNRDYILKNIFTHSFIHHASESRTLHKSIQHFMKLRKVCKDFNDWLSFEQIGQLCKNFCDTSDDLAVKDDVLCMLMVRINNSNHNKFRFPVLILVSAGANANICMGIHYLLERAVLNNDTELATVLFQHKADANIKKGCIPIFYHCKTAEVAQVFINNGIDIHVSSHPFPNVLFFIIHNDEYSLELIQFYLKHSVNPKALNRNDNCLLHVFAEPYIGAKVNDNFLKQVELILTVIPTMINAKNISGKTPLDLAYRSLEKAQKNSDLSQSYFEKVIKLYKNAGAIRSNELLIRYK